MRFLFTTLLICLLSFLLGLFLPFWSVAIAAFVVPILTRPSPRYGFLAGFIGVALCWWILSAWRDFENEQLLSTQVAQIMNIPSGILLVIITGLLGGLIGGFAAMTGASVYPKKVSRV